MAEAAAPQMVANRRDRRGRAASSRGRERCGYCCGPKRRVSAFYHRFIRRISPNQHSSLIGECASRRESRLSRRPLIGRDYNAPRRMCLQWPMARPWRLPQFDAWGLSVFLVTYLNRTFCGAPLMTLTYVGAAIATIITWLRRCGDMTLL